MMFRRWALTLVSVFCVSAEATADVAKARLGRQMFVAFQCSTYAELAGNHPEQKRLFEYGYSTGRDFTAAARKREFTEEEADSTVPFVVMLMLGGPSDDFILGRVFENAMQSAFDEVVKKRNDGSDLPVSEWRNGGLRRIVAENRYGESNCELVR